MPLHTDSADPNVMEAARSKSPKKRRWVRLTRLCNNNCVFCLDKEAQNNTVLPYAMVMEDLKRGRDEEASRAILSGGEPTLHPDFLSIVKAAKGLGYDEVQVITNGRMFAYGAFMRQALQAGLTEITFSIHGHDPKLHDWHTRTKGSFAQAVKGLTNALKTGSVIVSADIVVTERNYRCLPSIVRRMNRLGVREFDLLHLVPFGNAWDNWKRLYRKPEDLMPFLHETLDYAGRQRIQIWTNRFPPECLEGHEEHIQDPNKLLDEINGRREMFEAFLRNDVPLPCAGERCPFCFVHGFCAELSRLKTHGRVDGNQVQPPCILERAVDPPLLPSGSAAFKADGTVDLLAFGTFFVERLYRVKGLRCAGCKHFDECDGIPINYVRRFGFPQLGFEQGRIAQAGSTPVTSKAIGPGLDNDLFSDDHRHRIWLNSPCGFDCVFCSLPDMQRPNGNGPGEKDRLRRDLERGRARGRRLLTVMGFEPLNYGGILDLIRGAKDMGYAAFEIFSTGVGLADGGFASELVRALGGTYLVHIPLHGDTATLHDSITRVEGSFAKLTLGVRKLLELSGPERIQASTVLVRQNFKQIGAVQSLAGQWGLTRFGARLPYPLSRSKQDRYRDVAVRISEMMPYLLACRPPVLADPRYPCTYVSFLMASAAAGETWSVLSDRLPYLFGGGPDGGRRSQRGRPEAVNPENHHHRVDFVRCAHAQSCAVATYCSLLFCADYVDLFGDSEFRCVRSDELQKLAEESRYPPHGGGVDA